MRYPRTTDTDPEELDEGDEFVFNNRTVPCTVTESREVHETVGSINVTYRVKADGPDGGRIWLEVTGTGRIRVKESAPWGAYANVRRLERA